MNAVSLILRIVAIVGAIAAGVGWYLTNGKLDEKQTELTDTQTQLADTEAELTRTGNELTATTSQLNETESNLDRASENLAQTSAELEKTRSELSDVSSKASKLEVERNQLANEKNELQSEVLRLVELQDFKRRYEQEQRRALELTEQLNSMRDAKSQVDSELDIALDRIAKLESGTGGAGPATATVGNREVVTSFQPLPVDIVGMKSTGQGAAILRSSNDNALLVISRGTADGIEEGTELGLAVGFGTPVKVRTTRALDSYSLVSVLPGQDTRDLTEGAQVVILR